MWNNGDGVPVEIHKEEKVYVPELIFGHLLTSSNYDDDEKKVGGHPMMIAACALALPFHVWRASLHGRVLSVVALPLNR